MTTEEESPKTVQECGGGVDDDLQQQQSAAESNNKKVKPAKIKDGSGPPPNIQPKPKLSKAERRELQEKQRAEKAALQSQKQQQGGGGGGSGSSCSNKPQAKVQPQATQSSNQSTSTKVSGGNAPSTSSLAVANKSSATGGGGGKENQSNTLNVAGNAITANTVSFVSHLPQYHDPNKLFLTGATIRSISTISTSDVISGSGGGSSGGGGIQLHPCVIQTGYMYATGQIKGGNARCRAMLHCYLRVLRDFVPPPSSTTSNVDLRHVIDQIVLKPAFQFWTEYCRSHSVSMGNAFTFLKTATASSLERDMSWPDMLSTLTEIILAYERERIDYADMAIAENACSKLLFLSKMSLNNNNKKSYSLQQQQQHQHAREEVLLTYGNSEAVRVVLQQAATSTSPSKKKFRVIVVDSTPLLEGRDMLHYLQKLNIQCTYCLLSGLTYVLKDATKVLLGAASLSSDGSVFGRIGTAVVAMAAHHQHIPVLICSETYKISNRVFTESITNNEIGNPNDIFPIIHDDNESKTTKDGVSLHNHHHFKRLNLLYDLTPAEFISGIITELGIVPPTSIAVLLREMNSQDISKANT